MNRPSIEVALYRSRTDQKIKHLRAVLRAVRDVNRLITRERDAARLLAQACQIVVRTRGYRAVWVTQPGPDSHGPAPGALAGRGLNLLEMLAATGDPSAGQRLPWRRALRTRRPAVCENIATDAAFARWRDAAVRRGIIAAAAIPMIHADCLYGALCVLASQAGVFSGEEIKLLNELAGDLAYALSNLAEEARRRQAEDQVRQQAALLDLADDAILVCDLEDRIVYWSQGARRLYGWTAKQAAGRKVTGLFCQQSPAHAAAKARLLAAGQWHDELLHSAKGGREVRVNSRWTLVRDAQGQPKSILVINRDITEQKRVEAYFLRVQRLDGIGLLAGGIAHDLNNVLEPILLTSEMLREDLPPATSRRLLDTLETSARRGAEIVKRVLTFARGAEGEKSPLHLTHIVHDMAGMARETFPKNVEIAVDAPTNLSPVNGNGTHLLQVLLNLCLNARDAMPDGGTLSLSAQNLILDEHHTQMIPGLQPGPYVRLTVTDTGVGIPLEIQDRIFDPFFTTKAPHKGTGLGLSTVVGIVRDHGGFVQVKSRVGSGAAFEVYLPALAGQQPEEAKMSLADAAPAGHGELILVVDDEAKVRDLTRRVLERHGYAVLLAEEGGQAMRLFAAHQGEIRAVVADLAMPVMDGATLARALRRLNASLPIIGASGLAEIAPSQAAAELGFTAFLMKPYDITGLLQALHQALHPSQAANPAPGCQGIPA
jgi:PAS domain S-box-containing protein